MSDPTRKRSKDHGASAVTQSNVVPMGGVFPLRFWITPANGTPPYEVDLTAFAEGLSSESRAGKFGAFRGRPSLIRSLLPGIMPRCAAAPKESFSQVSLSLRHFWRFLETLPEDVAPKDLKDLNEVIAVLWLRSGVRDIPYGCLKTTVAVAREAAGLHRQTWPTKRSSSPGEANAVCPIGMRRLYNALKLEAGAIMRLWKEGDDLAARGVDPGPDDEGEAMSCLENQAWLLKNRGSPFLPEAVGNLRAMRSVPYETRPVPGGRPAHATGINGKLRWFFPGVEDISVFYLLFAIQSGWNPETNFNIDVSSEDAWCSNHPHRAELAVIRSMKWKVGTEQIALALRRPQFHMVQLLRTLTERTEVLRAEARRQIVEVDRLLASSPGDMTLRARRADLDAVSKSPWVYLSRSHRWGWAVYRLASTANLVNDVLRGVIERHDVRDAKGALVSITASDLRDAWIGYAYANSGYSWLVAKLAAGHSNASTLRSYLRQRQWRTHGEERLTTLLDAVWTEIRGRRVIDGAVLRRMVEAGEITDAQRRRWEEHKSRTRIGVGCRNPTSPPRALAPDHVEGEICRIQRCVLCVHGLVFADSLDGLARRKAELTHIRETMPVSAWLQSTFGDEFEALEATLKLFAPADVDAAYAAWVAAIRSGDAYVFDQEGAYDERAA